MQNQIYKKFMKEYHIKHEVCPKCGSKSHKSTLVFYMVDPSQPENYQDLNQCICNNCGDQHIYHDRISLEEFNQKNNDYA